MEKTNHNAVERLLSFSFCQLFILYTFTLFHESILRYLPISSIFCLAVFLLTTKLVRWEEEYSVLLKGYWLIWKTVNLLLKYGLRGQH